MNSIEILTGDCRELSKNIPDKSIDLIFTDPPYIKKYLYLYDWLSDETSRVLKNDGFLLTYVGTYWKDDVMRKMSRNWEYYFDFILVNAGNSPIMWQRKVISRHKSIIAYRKKGSNAKPRTNVLSLWVGGGKDKRFHTWGQDESSARYYIDCFSGPGELVYDPFCGGGYNSGNLQNAKSPLFSTRDRVRSNGNSFTEINPNADRDGPREKSECDGVKYLTHKI